MLFCCGGPDLGTREWDQKPVCSWAALWRVSFFFFNYLFLVTQGLCYCEQAFSRCSKQGLLFIALDGLSLQWLRLLWTTGVWVSAVVTHRLSCSEACGIFLDQGSNPCPPPLASDSNPLYHQGSPRVSYTMRKLYLIWAFSKSPPPM